MKSWDMSEFPSCSLEDVLIPADDDYTFPDISLIVPGLWLGALPMNVDPDIKFIVSVNGNHPIIVHPHQERFTCHFVDTEYKPVPEELVKQQAHLVNRCRAKGNTLVHCAQGLNRSALVVGLALVLEGMLAVDAVALLREKRSKSVLFNRVFHKWLLSYGR